VGHVKVSASEPLCRVLSKWIFCVAFKPFCSYPPVVSFECYSEKPLNSLYKSKKRVGCRTTYVRRVSEEFAVLEGIFE
jgi:hypothetical protein